MISFKQMRVSSRLTVAGVVVFLGLMLIVAYTLIQIRSDALAAHRARLNDLVEISKGIIANYQKLELDNKLTHEEAQLQAKEALRTLRFSNDDYFFLYDFDGRALMVAGNPKIEGEVLLGKTDKKGFKLWDAFVEIGRGPGNGYVEYWFPRAGQNEPKPKLAYISAVPQWQWIVGTGVYTDDVNDAVNKAALRYGLLSLIVLVVAAVVALLVSRSVVSQLGGEPRDAAESMRKIANGDLGVEIVLAKNDSVSLMASLKLMQMKLKNITTAIQDNSSDLTNQVEQFNAVAKSYAETKSEEGFFDLSRSIKKIGKTAEILGKSIARFKL